MKFPVLALVFAVQAARGKRISTGYIAKPIPLHLPDLSSNQPDTNNPDMQLYNVDVPGHGHVKVFGYPTYQDVHVSGALGRTAQWEGGLVARYCRILEEAIAAGTGANFLDVGANIGAVTLPVAACLEGRGEVFAVEGMPSIAEHLKAGVLANSMAHVAIYPYAVSSPSAGDTLRMALNPTNKGGSTVQGNKPWSNHSTDNSVVSAKVTTLDSMARESPGLQRLRLAKLDIEGSEGLALKGGQELFSQYPPCTLVVELNSEWLARAGTPGAEVVNMLSASGYDVSSIPAGAYGFGTYVLDQQNMPGCLSRIGGHVNTTQPWSLLRAAKSRTALRMK
mmetsp:Transcript_50325/g.145966  ORF Transcript_50325/g.145966 Transcript_50325/m.145966 type:complete len:336 (-) Transcript_50325:59-1066(-)